MIIIQKRRKRRKMLLYMLVTAAFLYYTTCLWRKTAQLPPGPFPVLILGNLPQIMYYGWRCGGLVPALKVFKKKYGPVFTVWLGPLPLVNIADYKISHEAMVRHGGQFVDRWGPALMNVARGGRGLVISNGSFWQEQRRFSLQVLRDLGVSKNIVEERIMAEFDLRCGEIDQLPRATDIDVISLFDRLVGGIITRMLFRVKPNEKEEDRFYELKNKLDESIESLNIVDMFIKQWVLNTPILNSRWNRLRKPIEDVKGFITKQIAERFKAIENGDHVLDSSQPQDYVDAFIAKMRDEEEQGNAETTFDEETLAVNALDLWIAGQETTTTTLSWAMIYLSKHPQVAEKARKEILEVTNGGTRPLSLQDKSRTPYLIATIAEVQRHASILNLNLNRLTATDTEIGGYTVPKGTIVAAQLSLIFADDALFPNPEKFDPDRFMNEESATSNVVAFGMGKRACLGESLAKAELYLILGNILLRYSFKAIGGPLRGDPIIKYGVMKKPKRFRMVFTRNQ